jgi:multidrug efflux pump subunit AcrA (membrane-fusion protein)
MLQQAMQLSVHADPCMSPFEAAMRQSAASQQQQQQQPQQQLKQQQQQQQQQEALLLAALRNLRAPILAAAAAGAAASQKQQQQQQQRQQSIQAEPSQKAATATLAQLVGSSNSARLQLDLGDSNRHSSGSSAGLNLNCELPGGLLPIPGFRAVHVLQGNNSTFGVISASLQDPASSAPSSPGGVTNAVSNNDSSSIGSQQSLRADVWDGVAWRNIGMYPDRHAAATACSYVLQLVQNRNA